MRRKYSTYPNAHRNTNVNTSKKYRLISKQHNSYSKL